MSIPVKRLRESKFTEKRNPYKKYNKEKWNWTEFFTEIDLLKSEVPKILHLCTFKTPKNLKNLKI